jgi:alanyl-tRNA synthetase
MVAVGSDAVKSGGNAGALAKRAAEILGGGGGGKPDLAQGGGSDSSKLKDAIEAARSMVS